MKDLIKALQILGKYTESAYPTGCEHDELRVYVSPDDVCQADIDALSSLGFDPEPETDSFLSFRYGSA